MPLSRMHSAHLTMVTGLRCDDYASFAPHGGLQTAVLPGDDGANIAIGATMSVFSDGAGGRSIRELYPTLLPRLLRSWLSLRR